MEVLITGATGLLGGHLIDSLQSRGDKVRILALPGENTSAQEARGIRVFRGDIRQPASLVEPMDGADGVLHLAAMMGVWRPLEDYRAVNVAGTENVARAALKARVKRLVHVSSWTVYGMNIPHAVTEDMPLRPFPEPYGQTKAEGDLVVQRLIAEEGLPAAIIRPGTFFGPGDRLHFGRIADRIHAGSWIKIGSGRNALPFVYVTDVVEGLLLLLDHPNAAGQAFNITNDQALTQDEMWSAIADEVGARPPRLWAPYHPLYAAGFAAEKLSAVTHSGKQPPVTRLGVMLFGGNNRHSIDKARRELGFSPRVPLREGIRMAGQWWRDQHPQAARTEPARTAS